MKNPYTCVGMRNDCELCAKRKLNLQDHKVTMHKSVEDSCDICDINSSGPGQLELTEGLNMKNVSTGVSK